MRRPDPRQRVYLNCHEAQSWCMHRAPGPCIESGVQRDRWGYERICFWIPGLGYARRFMMAHLVAWILRKTGATTVDELYLYYLEVRASGLQGDHECDNAGCRNPDHVTPRTQSENIMAGKDRAAWRAENFVGRVTNEEWYPEAVEF